MPKKGAAASSSGSGGHHHRPRPPPPPTSPPPPPPPPLPRLEQHRDALLFGNSSSSSGKDCDGEDSSPSSPGNPATTPDGRRRRAGQQQQQQHGHTIIPLTARPPHLRLDTMPFAITYLTLIYLDSAIAGKDRRGGVLGIALSWSFPLVLVTHVTLFLLCQWSVRVRTVVGYSRANTRVPLTPSRFVDSSSSKSDGGDVDGQPPPPSSVAERAASASLVTSRWTHCLVIPPANSGKSEIVPVRHSYQSGSTLHLQKGTGTGEEGKGEKKRCSISDSPSRERYHPCDVVTLKFQQVVFRCDGGGESSSVADDGEYGEIWRLDDDFVVGDDGGAATPTPTAAAVATGRGDEAELSFRRLHLPVDFPISFYSRWTGHSTSKTFPPTLSTYGPNSLHIPSPSFLYECLLPQLVAPFFVFQVFCVALWCLDEYWYYALFTLFTLVLFECTVAYNRLKALGRLRETLREPYSIKVYRDGEWDWIRSDEIVVGDLVSVTRGTGHLKGFVGKHEQVRQVPADMLLLRGTAVVDEAMLTGESVPQMKEALSSSFSASGEDYNDLGGDKGEAGAGTASAAAAAAAALPPVHLDVEDPAFKRSVIFSGTTIVDHHPENPTAASSSSSNSNSAKNAKQYPIDSVPDPKNGGCLAFVLRTGFETTQGQLLRTMIHASTSSTADGVNTRDTFVFIFILLLCALLSASMVLVDGWSDETRNRFKLVLHVIIIITSVIPPELPMELSLAVTSSLSDLASRRIFCTEPYRIPLAGRVDTCCFDKTGTLTSDEMRLRGVRLMMPPDRGGGAGTKDGDGTSTAIGSTGAAREIDCGDGTRHGSNADLTPPDSPSVPRSALRVMVGCQSLARSSTAAARGGGGPGGGASSLIGDPLERAVLDGCRWTLRSNSVVVPDRARDESSETDRDGGGVTAGGGKIGKERHGGEGTDQAPVVIQHRFPFESRLKRMTVLARDEDEKNLFSLTKGAPESMKTLLAPSSVPSNYDKVYRYHMSRGQRVLCLAQKNLGETASVSSIRERGRGSVERDLDFVGFLVFDCPLKPDSSRVINELKASSHRTVMITGDAALTACEVARQVGIIDTSPKDTYDLREMKRFRGGQETGSGRVASAVADEETAFAFVPINAVAGEYSAGDCIAFVPNNVEVLKRMVSSSELALCVSGEVLTRVAIAAVKRSHHARQIAASPRRKRLIFPPIDGKTVLLDPAAQKELMMLAPCVSVFARCAPRQKEAVIAALNGAGAFTLMCGDGTNDVGALKQAHVGISIISVPEIEAKQREATETISAIKAEEKAERKARRRERAGKPNKKGGAKTKKSGKTLEKSLQQLAEAQEELSFVALGDASIASPFTSRTMSIGCCKDILQQGRCTLVTMLQIYKILGVNCLVNALVLSTLHMSGVKQGDRQLTAVGLVIAGLFFFVSRAKPLSSLSSTRPPSSVLCPQALTSISVQFFIHLAAILAVTDISMPFLDPDDPSIIPDGPFNPNTLNTACFLMTVLATLNTFVCNYRGRPYVQSLRENRFLFRSVQVCMVALFACAMEVFEPLNQLLQLSALPSFGEQITSEAGHSSNRVLSVLVETLGFKVTLGMIMFLDTGIAYKVEKMIVKKFEG